MPKKFKRLLALALVVLSFSTPALAASYSARVLSSSMTIYNAQQQPVNSLSQRRSFTVTAISGDWARISYGGETGYARMKDIIFDKRIPAVTNRKASIRFVTRESYRRNKYYSATIAKEMLVYVVGFNGSDALVYNEDGTALGYIARSALSKI